MKPIYEPKGAAKEYGDYALNIYTGCPHRCYYCYAPNVLHNERDKFHSDVIPRKDIVEATRKQLEREKITNKTIHLCFTCDPYPYGVDSSATREIIKLIKGSGNHVQILTKNGEDAVRDFDLLDENDWFGITYAGYDGYSYDPAYIPKEEPCSGPPHYRLKALNIAFNKGIKTWVSCEPVLNPNDVIQFIDLAEYVNLWKVGKLNYHKSDVDWKDFGERVTKLLESKKRLRGIDYYIKDSLKKEINRN